MIETVISSSVLIIAVIAVRRVFRTKISSRLKYALWSLVLIRLLLPVSLFGSGISIMNAVPSTNNASQPLYLGRISSVPLTEGDTVYAKSNGELTEPNSFGHAVLSDDGNSVTRYAVKTTAADVLKFVWIVGAAAAALWIAIVNLVFYTRLRKCREPYPEGRGLPLKIYVADYPASPCLFGLLRPAIYLTPGAASDEAFPYVYAHEYCHYRHGDHFWTVVRGLCLAAYWWNPLVWAAAILSRADSETACDESAVRLMGEDNRLIYGKTLVDMIAERPSPSAILCSATTMTGGRREIEKRLLLIVKKPRTYVPAIIAVLLILAVSAGCAFSGAKEGKKGDLYERFGLGLAIPESSESIVDFTPTKDLDDNTYLEAWHIPSRDAGCGGFLCSIVRHTREEFPEYENSMEASGGALHFAYDDNYIYSVEFPTDVQIVPEYADALESGTDAYASYFYGGAPAAYSALTADFIERNHLSPYDLIDISDDVFNKRQQDSSEVEKTYRLYGCPLELTDSGGNTGTYFLTSITLRKNSAMVTYIYDGEDTKLMPSAVPDIIAYTSDVKEYTLQLVLQSSGTMVFETKNLDFQHITKLKIGDNELKLNSPRPYPSSEDAFKNGLDNLADMTYSELLAYSVGSDGAYSDGAFSELRKRFLSNPEEFAAHFMMPAYPLDDDYKKSLDVINMEYEATRGFDWAMNQQLLYNILYYCTPEERDAAIKTMGESKYEVVQEAASLFRDAALPLS